MLQHYDIMMDLRFSPAAECRGYGTWGGRRRSRTRIATVAAADATARVGRGRTAVGGIGQNHRARGAFPIVRAQGYLAQAILSVVRFGG